MPAIRVSRDNVQITIEIEPSVDPPEASFYDPESNSWQEPHPNFAKQVHELEQVADGDWAWCDVTVTARFSDLTGTAYLGQCSYKDEADFKADGYYDQMVDEAIEELQQHIEIVYAAIHQPSIPKGHRNAWGVEEREMPSALEDYR